MTATRYPADQETLDAWQQYPVRLESSAPSRCCGKTTLLVRARAGGLVSANCSKCNRPDRLSASEFARVANPLWVTCPKCVERMTPNQGADGKSNYGFLCERCSVFIRLADLVPHYSKSV
jgi:hypothetical protein